MKLQTPIRVGLAYGVDVAIELQNGELLVPTAPGVLGRAWLVGVTGERLAEFTVVPGAQYFSLQLTRQQTALLPPGRALSDFLVTRDGLERWQADLEFEIMNTKTRPAWQIP